jgi:hypothetical protein
MIKKIAFLLMTLAVVVSSCSDYETYGDKKDKERNAISKYISDHGITVISEDQFNKQGHTTDVSKNEFVKFDRNGVYLQIVRQGCGSELEDGGRGTLVCRFAETNMFADTVQTCNNTPGYAATPDRMFISRATSVYSAQFLDGVMSKVYGATVPAGWLVPMPYIKVGHPTSENEMCSKVRLIVPHTQGHAYSSSNVIPYYYEITYEREV